MFGPFDGVNIISKGIFVIFPGPSLLVHLTYQFNPCWHFRLRQTFFVCSSLTLKRFLPQVLEFLYTTSSGGLSIENLIYLWSESDGSVSTCHSLICRAVVFIQIVRFITALFVSITKVGSLPRLHIPN